MLFDKFYVGESKSKYDQNGFDDSSNVDIYTELGSWRCQFALTSESTTPNEACVSAITPDGTVYFFSKTTGKIWKRAVADATYSLYATNVNTAHRGARYFNGSLYFWNATELGKTATCTMTIASPCVVTINGHGLSDDDAITFILLNFPDLSLSSVVFHIFIFRVFRSPDMEMLLFVTEISRSPALTPGSSARR